MEIFNTLQQMTIEIPAAGLDDLWNNVLKAGSPLSIWQQLLSLLFSSLKTALG